MTKAPAPEVVRGGFVAAGAFGHVDKGARGSVATVPKRNPFTDDDLSDLARRGVSVEEALAQLDRIARGSGEMTLERPALAGDGVHRITPAQRVDLRRRYEQVRRAGRITSFVPASGAASRMFSSLLAWRERPGPLTPAELAAAAEAMEPGARETAAFFARLAELALAEPLARELERRGENLSDCIARGPHRPVLDALLDVPGLGYGRRPKSMVAFHADPQGGVRSALDEHLVDAARLLSDSRKRVRLHATLAPEHEADAARAIESSAERWASRLGVHYELSRSLQRPSSDTLAGDPAGGPFRDAGGRLVFRPAGHGALLDNLAETRADMAFIKNIDNVAAEPWKQATDEWMPVLIGALAELEQARNAAWERLEGGFNEVAESLLEKRFGEGWPEFPAELRADDLRARLDRPIRVCGMVPATGEPGGGPFWVRGRDGRVSLQIVDDPQVSRDPGQRSIWARSTHFNPVFMALLLRDPTGRPYDLTRYADPDAVIVTRKPMGGRELLALERPGLWNGGMARWLTLLVEVPAAVFTPVKTVIDLLRPEHRIS